MNDAAPPPPPPVEPVRCQSRQSSAGLSAARRRLRYVLLVDREKGEAALGLCECPRCTGLLELKRTLSSGPPPNGEEEYSQSEESYDGEDFDDGGESDFDDPSMLPQPSLVRGFTEEEYYVSSATSKADRRTGSGPGSSRPKSANKAARRKEMKAKVTTPKKKGLVQKARKVETRAEEKAAQLEARRENINARVLERGTRQRTLKARRSLPSLNVGHRTTVTAAGTVQARRSRPSRNRANGGQRTTVAGAVLSAAELGVEEGSMYDRLIQIMEGDDITPEDFDLLLQLDRNNFKSTMEVSQISQFEVVVIGPKEGQVPRSDLSGGCCLICLESFERMDDGAELRRLPCGHFYCKPCIDDWLQDHSVKCPDLSCFWASAEEVVNEEATAASTAGDDSHDVSGGQPSSASASRCGRGNAALCRRAAVARR